MTGAGGESGPFGELTAKQREVLDLLIQHKTSKEISRILGISPHTVDQRIMLSRAKLGVASRSEVAQAYRRLTSIYERSVYGESHIAEPLEPRHSGLQEDEVVGTALSTPAEAMMTGPALTAIHGRSAVLPQPYYHVLPEIFDGPYGTLMRLGYIVGITVFLIVAILGGLAMYAQLSTIVDY